MNTLVIKHAIRQSTILSFLKHLNQKVMIYFYNSKTYTSFRCLNSAFRRIITKNIKESELIKTIRRVYRSISSTDVGFFIILVVVFNTVLMKMLDRAIDIFSISGRALFLLIGLAFIYAGRR